MNCIFFGIDTVKYIQFIDNQLVTGKKTYNSSFITHHYLIIQHGIL